MSAAWKNFIPAWMRAGLPQIFVPGSAFDPTHEFAGLSDWRLVPNAFGEMWCMLCHGWHPRGVCFSNQQGDWPTLYFSRECVPPMPKSSMGPYVNGVYLREVDRILRGLPPPMRR